MPSIFVDPPSGPGRRELLYAGNLVVLTDVGAVSEFVAFARDELIRAFAPHDPRHAHDHYTDEQLAGILGTWKSWFARCAKTRLLTGEIIRGAGFDPTLVYYDMPQARTSYPTGHIRTGVAHAFPWHRDTWYTAPAQQINWWFPIFELDADNGLAFDLSSFSRPVDNDSATFDYSREAVKPRLAQSTSDSAGKLALPGASAWEAPVETVIVPRPGQVILFSGAQLHRSIPNTSVRARYSVDFRTVCHADVVAGAGAALVDSECTGTALRQFSRVTDGAPVPSDLIRLVEKGQR